MAATITLTREDYTVGWICALPLEMAAAQALLDQVHGPLAVQPTDQNAYTLGAMGEHNLVIACLPSGAYGTTSATSVAMQLLSSFPSIRFGLMVGIGGAVPSRDADIRLGDIVVSSPADTHGGVVQYDQGKALSGGDFQRTGMLNHPPRILLTALSKLRANHLLRGSHLRDFLADIHHKNPQQTVDFARPALQDHLYRADYDHRDMDAKSCRGCDATKTVTRPSRTPDTPVVHYGLIASGNQVVKNSRLRDKLGQELGVYCVEMEAAGLMNSFPCLVIRGTCDYADSHKNNTWQGYAAANAAAYAKDLLTVVPASDRPMVRTLQEAAADSKNLLLWMESCINSNMSGEFHVPFELTKVPAVSEFIGRTADLDQLWELLQPDASQLRKVVVLHGMGGLGSFQDHQVLSAAHNLGRLYWNQGKHKEAEKLYQQVLAGRERVLGPDHISTLNTVHNLGVLYHDQGGLKEAEEMYQRVLTGHQKASGSNHISTLDTVQLDTIQNLGNLYCTQQRLEEAEQMCQQALASYKKVLGPSHTSTLDAIHNLGNVYWSQQKLKEAENLYRQALEGKEKVLGPDHTSTLDTVHNLGVVYYDQGKLQEAEEMYQRALAGKEKAFGLEHLSVLDTVFNLGRLYWTQAELEKAKQMYQRTLAGREKALGPDHISTLHTVHNLGALYSAQNMPQEAERMHQRVLAGYERALGPDDISTLDFAHNLAILYCKQGKLEKAKAMFERVLSGKKKVFGPSCPSVLAVINNLGNLYKHQGRLEKAKDMYRYALDGWESSFGLHHPSTLGAMNNLGVLYQDQGRVKEAEEMYQQALTGYKKIAGLDDVSTLDMVLNLGDLYRDQNRLQRARKMYQRAHAGYERTLGPDHQMTREAADRVRLYSRLREVISGYFRRI
ncbi:purine and uridine phosphorylase [Aspergillus sclerotiicarbonarius CBS 121057]|uniref:Purine and uridine phosphorylase n=1 Tax=Aspergillus sclerotiicarbonarius (strain CBS 121057 / IBT 28362) TaxID=1448318 RepID=A0A319EZR8_ASPSB|nr:purine and uridine phosphorylase [Aspergillus sclerotiicarbonarius CBS 121057]